MVTPAKPTHFILVYCRLFERIDYAEAILELGVHQGGGVEFFAALNPWATVYGIDQDISLVPEPLPDNVVLIAGDATDADLLTRIPEMDVVIDDASHRWADVRKTFDIMWPRTRRAYVIEDIHVAYLPDSEWSGGEDTMTWLRRLVDDLVLGRGDIGSITFHPDLVVIER